MLVYFTKILKNQYSKNIAFIISGIRCVNSKEKTSLEEKESGNTSHLISEPYFFMLDSRYLSIPKQVCCNNLKVISVSRVR